MTDATGAARGADFEPHSDSFDEQSIAPAESLDSVAPPQRCNCSTTLECDIAGEVSIAESEPTIDASSSPIAPPSPAELPALIVEITPPPPQRASIQQSHLYGVRATTTGVLFVQPIDGSRRITIAGDFNDWSPHATPMRRNDDAGVFEALIPIAPGRHQYRLIIDGVWQADPYNPHQLQNEYGEPNSLLIVEPRPVALPPMNTPEYAAEITTTGFTFSTMATKELLASSRH